ncbi:MAG: hypothetical protein F9K32_13470 [Desulfobulbaceae bacterium]|nr:MAG: hypothetical protein F9K32_13470 [Desulfobulbaceae bacterium]
MKKIFRKIEIILVVVWSVQSISVTTAEAFLFHATSKAAARKIAQKGFAANKMCAEARFGKGVYLSESRATALKEAPKAQSILKYKDVQKNKLWDYSKPKLGKLRTVLPTADFRGTFKKGIIGPKLGRKLSHAASKEGAAIRYRSVKAPKTANVMVPNRVYRGNPGILKPANPVH